MVTTEVLERTAAVVFARCDALWIMVIHAPPTAADMLAAEGPLTKMRAIHPQGFATLTWVRPSAGFSMDRDARNAASEVTKAFDDVIACQGTLIEASGFAAATVRMIIAGLDLITHPKSPTKVFSTLEDAVPWCLSHGGGAGAVVEVTQAVRALSPS